MNKQQNINEKQAADLTVRYHLPENWDGEREFSFEHLSDLVEQVHNSAYTATLKAINRFATIRNYVIGFYIVEYEQNGSDRAKYGDRLLKRLAEKVNKRGINETLLQVSRSFYLAYPQIHAYLTGQKYATASQKLEDRKYATASHKLAERSLTSSDELMTSPETLIGNLSFSHIREILKVDDPLAR